MEFREVSDGEWGMAWRTSTPHRILRNEAYEWEEVFSKINTAPRIRSQLHEACVAGHIDS